MVIYMITVIIAQYVPLPVCIADKFQNFKSPQKSDFFLLKIENICVTIIEESHNLHVFLHYYS